MGTAYAEHSNQVGFFPSGAVVGEEKEGAEGGYIPQRG